jgi:hypothetical protein
MTFPSGSSNALSTCEVLAFYLSHQVESGGFVEAELQERQTEACRNKFCGRHIEHSHTQGGLVEGAGKVFFQL